MKGILCNLCTPWLSIGWQYRPICQSTCRLKIGLLSIAELVDMSICQLTLDRVLTDRYVGRYTSPHSANKYKECQMLVEYCLTVGGISAHYQWHIGRL